MIKKSELKNHKDSWGRANKAWLSLSLVLFMLFSFASCDYIKPKKESEESENETPLARVKDKYLYEKDLGSVLKEAMSKEDSASMVNRFINSWIRQQLMLSKAEEIIDVNMSQIERKVQDYRYALISFEFKKKFISENLNTDVGEEEINEYYKENLDNFLLNQNIVRCRYVQVPLNAPKSNKIPPLIKSDKEKDKKELNSYCFQFASNYNLEDSIWLNFDDIVLNTPLKNIPNKIQFLKSNKFVQTQDSAFKYLLYIKEYKILDQLSPLEFVRDQIENIIINKRKVALSKELEDQVFKEAIEENSFEIYGE